MSYVGDSEDLMSRESRPALEILTPSDEVCARVGSELATRGCTGALVALHHARCTPRERSGENVEGSCSEAVWKGVLHNLRSSKKLITVEMAAGPCMKQKKTKFSPFYIESLWDKCLASPDNSSEIDGVEGQIPEHRMNRSTSHRGTKVRLPNSTVSAPKSAVSGAVFAGGKGRTKRRHEGLFQRRGEEYLDIAVDIPATL